MQLRKEAWKKFRTSTGFEPVTSRLPVRWDWDCYKEQEKNKPITDKRVTSNDPRDNCEKHFDSSSLLVSKVATAAKFPNFNNRDFKIQRRRRQRESQKNIRFN